MVKMTTNKIKVQISFIYQKAKKAISNVETLKKKKISKVSECMAKRAGTLILSKLIFLTFAGFENRESFVLFDILVMYV